MSAPPPPLLSFAGGFGLLASLERLVTPSRLCMRSLQWHLLTHWSPESDHPSLPVPLSLAMQWISLRGWCGTVFSTGFLIRDCGSESAPIFGRVSVGMGLTPPRSSRVRCVFGARYVVPYLSSRIEGHILALPSIPEGVTCLCVTAMCDNSTVVASVDKRSRTVSRSLCSLAGRLLRWSECLDLHLDTGYLPGQSSVLVDLLSCRDQVIGAAWSLHPPVVTALLSAWGSPLLDLFATRLPMVLPLFCSLVLNPQTVFLDAFRVPWGNLGVSAFPPLLSLVGWWLESERPQPLQDSGRPPLAGEGVVRRPSPSFLVGFLVHLRRDMVLSVSPVSGSQSALHSVSDLQDLVRATYLEIFCVP